jgi:predicted ester cyclase
MNQSDENKALIRLIIEEGFNGGNLAVADGRFTDDYTAHVPGIPGLPSGADGFKRVIGMWRAAFGDLHMTIESMVAEGDLVSNRFTTRGTHTGPLFGLAPTGKQMVVEGQEVHRVVDGKVAESWVGDDIPGILVQLGLVELPIKRPGPPPNPVA